MSFPATFPPSHEGRPTASGSVEAPTAEPHPRVAPPPQAEATPFQWPFGVFVVYAQDTRGLGHITRTLTITQHLLDAHKSYVGYIMTRSKFAHTYTWPQRCDYIKIPARKTPHIFHWPREVDEASKRHFTSLRGQILRDAVLGLAPDLMLVDHEPLGSAAEFREGLWALKEQSPETKFVFGLRDIMDDPAQIRASWRRMGVYEAFEHLYDGIAVFGEPEFYDVAEAYAIPDSVRHKLHYCGYVVREQPATDPDLVRQQHGLPEKGPLVLATVGSGGDGYPVLDAAFTAIQQVQAQIPDLCAILLTGPFMGLEEQAALFARATPTCRVVTWADSFQLMGAADAIVTMGGYNSLCEGLVVARPLVIVPRSTVKVEQQIRAEILAERGLAQWVHPKAMRDGTSLAAALRWALEQDRDAHARRVRGIFPSLVGGARTCAYLSEFLRPSVTRA
jgi:predicted glycosyltransferase